MKKILCCAVAISIFAAVCYVLSAEKKYKIVVLWTGAGEQEWAKRLELVCSKMNGECLTVFCPKHLSSLENTLLSDVSIASANQSVKEFKPDFVISLSKRCQQISSDTKKYLAISGDCKKIFEAACSDSNELLDYHGLLHASPFTATLQDFFLTSQKSFQGIDWYPSSPATRYKPTVPKRLFYCGFQWDNKRNGEEYRKMFSLLDQQGYLDVYGPPEKWDCVPLSIKGLLPFDGKSLIEAIRQSGITLIFHAQSHIELEAPTARIFEAAAACSVIISDKNPFIVREFGDNVLYVDGNLYGEELFLQINEHMKWILSHPLEAQEKAKKAHAIFLEKFTLEKQMQNLINLHEKIIR